MNSPIERLLREYFSMKILPPTRYMHEAIGRYSIKKDSLGRFVHYSENKIWNRDLPKNILTIVCHSISLVEEDKRKKGRRKNNKKKGRRKENWSIIINNTTKSHSTSFLHSDENSSSKKIDNQRKNSFSVYSIYFERLSTKKSFSTRENFHWKTAPSDEIHFFHSKSFEQYQQNCIR